MNDDQFARLSRLLWLQFLFVTGLFVVAEYTRVFVTGGVCSSWLSTLGSE